MFKTLFASLTVSAVFCSQSVAITVSQSLFDDPRFTVINKGRGQSFTPSELGDGSGSYGSDTSAFLNSFSFRFSPTGPNYTLANSTTLYIYDGLPALADLNSGTGALFASIGTSGDATDRIVTWEFENTELNLGTQYFALFSGDLQPVYSFASDPYSGGEVYGLTFDNLYAPGLSGLDAWFAADLTPASAIPEPAAAAVLLGMGFGISVMIRRRRDG